MTDEELLEVIATAPTWREHRPRVRETHIGYNLHDLRSLHVIAQWYQGSDEDDQDLSGWWFLLNDGNWGELLDDDMITGRYWELCALLNHVAPRLEGAEVRTIREHLGR